jgi:hypothetical protein
MKKGLTLLVCVAVLSTSLIARENHHKTYGRGDKIVSSPESVIELTKEQEDSLNFMYQEEKVARDVYRVLGDKWKIRIFKNIQKSEQRHMKAIKSLLEKYNLPIPVIEDETGVFDNEDLQALYEGLVDRGLSSKEEALRVGILIEETDIADLEERIVDAPNKIKRVFSRLLKGSQNHLRAFNRVLDKL